jgi:hypothetical protein
MQLGYQLVLLGSLMLALLGVGLKREKQVITSYTILVTFAEKSFRHTVQHLCGYHPYY